MPALPIAERWFARQSHDHGVTRLWEPHVVPLDRSNIWVVQGRYRDLVFDFGMGVRDLRAELADLIRNPVIAVASHAHYDHTGSFFQFEDRLAHPAEAGNFIPEALRDLRVASIPDDLRAYFEASGYGLSEPYLIAALPESGFDPEHWRQTSAGPTRLIDEGDMIDLGDRRFEVLHLPGHSPGGIGLWEAETGVLLAGDAIYDGPLLDGFPDSSVTDYLATMRRLLELPVTAVHGGHDPSFGRARMVQLVEGYIRSRAA